MKYTAYVMMGYPGSGKSFIAKSLVSDSTLYLSSDDLRVEMFGFRDQEHNKELFEELYKRAIDHFNSGDVIIDSTALTRKDRLKVVSILKKYFTLKLICVIRPINELVEENQIRKDSKPDEYIPDSIFKTILGRFQFPTKDEGWDDIIIRLNCTGNPNESYFKLNLMKDVSHDNPHHPETIREHIVFTTKMASDLGKSLRVCKLAAYHDNGKFYVIQYNKEKGYSQCIGHAAVSAYILLTDTIIFYLQALESLSREPVPINYDELVSLDFIFSYYLVYYHDYPFSLDRDGIIKSLSKPSKPLKYLFDTVSDDGNPNWLEIFVDNLLEFNEIDRMRAGNQL